MSRVPFPALGSVAIALAALLAGCIATVQEPVETASVPQVPAGVSSFSKLICEPVCNIQLSSLAGPANEVAIAMDPNDPLRLLGGAKDYNEEYTACVTISWYFSEDGGRSWREGYFHPPRDMPLPSEGSVLASLDDQSCESDPVPVFDGNGNALMSTLSYGGMDPGPGLPTYRLKPGAADWEPVAHSYEGTSDKQWADVDAETGDVYVVTRDLKDGAEHDEELVVSRDGGDSWEHVSYLDGIDFAQIAVRPGGHIYLVGLAVGGGAGTPADALLEANGSTVVLFHSADFGKTWTEPVTIAETKVGWTTSFLGAPRFYRTPPLPVVAAADDAARVAVAYFDDSGMEDWDVFVRVSQDGGKTWDEPVRVNDDTGDMGGADQWTPAVAVSPSGDVHVIWFDARNDPTRDGRLVDLYYAHSADGKTFDGNIRISESSFLPYLARHQNSPFFIGDYLGIVASDAEAAMIWPDTRNDRSEVFAAIVGG